MNYTDEQKNALIMLGEGVLRARVYYRKERMRDRMILNFVKRGPWTSVLQLQNAVDAEMNKVDEEQMFVEELGKVMNR